MVLNITCHHGYDTLITQVDDRIYERTEKWSIIVIEHDEDSHRYSGEKRRGRDGIEMSQEDSGSDLDVGWTRLEIGGGLVLLGLFLWIYC